MMSYYPILNAPGTHGWVTLSNFPPNNWESSRLQQQFVNVTWASDGVWITKNIAVVEPGTFHTVHGGEVADIVPVDSLPLLSLSLAPLPAESASLPTLDFRRTSVPAWRATLGLSSSITQTSYQGELDFFPSQGTLLSFGPFLQFGEDVQNYLLLLNLEKSPLKRVVELEVYDAAELTPRGRFTICNNKVNCISLDELDLKEDDLPLFICRGMAAIPLYFSYAKNGSYLSLEHTHPPASLVVHGKRWEAQKLLKHRWFERVL
jgi:hypothetical protein